MYKVFRVKLKTLIILAVLLAAVLLIFENASKTMFPLKYKEYVFKYSTENNLDPYLVFSVIKAESSFRSNAVSRKDARGLMQILPATGEWGAKNLRLEGYNVEMLFNPETNIKIGCWYLNKLIKQFDGNTDLAIAAYNGGSKNVSDWLKDKSYSVTGEKLEKIPFRETDLYLKRVKNYTSIYKRLYENKY